jgi:hypothetical protein
LHYSIEVERMPRGKYDRKAAKLARDAKKNSEGEKIPEPVKTPSTDVPPIVEAPAPVPTVAELSKKYKLPRGICRCGHQGDGPLSDHSDTERGEGMGFCAALDCDCKEFFFDRYTPFFANKGLRTEAQKKSTEETIRKLTADAVSQGKEKWAEAGEDGKGESGDTHREATTPKGADLSPAPEASPAADSGVTNGTQGEPAAIVSSILSPEHGAPPANNEPVICDGTPKYEPEDRITTGYETIDEKIKRTEKILKFADAKDEDLIKMLRAKGFKIIEPVKPKPPVYNLTYNPDEHTGATMIVTLTTKEQVLIHLYRDSFEGCYCVTISTIEDGILIQDAVRVSRGIRKLNNLVKKWSVERNERAGKE